MCTRDQVIHAMDCFLLFPFRPSGIGDGGSGIVTAGVVKRNIGQCLFKSGPCLIVHIIAKKNNLTVVL